MKKETQAEGYARRYCCLYHFATGKHHKDSSPCFNHVPLGIINPLHSTFARQITAPPQNVRVSSRAYDLNFHTHDLNEIENKESLPKRLAYPRVYVQQLKNRRHNDNGNAIAGFQAFLKGKQFQQTFELFRDFAKRTHFTSEEELLNSIKRFGYKHAVFSKKERQSTYRSQLLYSKQNFVQYLSELGCEQAFAQQFWKVAFNRSRFNEQSKKASHKEEEVVSMKAFAFNFKKFYLQELVSYKNCLSEAALRQRMLDLRLFLQPWFNRNIILKENYLSWKELQFQICAELKRCQQEQGYVGMLALIEMRNKIWLFMRTLAKIIFNQTDRKNVGLEVFNLRATELIEKHTASLHLFEEFANHFQTVLLAKEISLDQPFKITDLLLEAKSSIFASQMQQITRSLRGLFKYLYFFGKSPCLRLNQRTLNLDCSSIVEISFNELSEYLSFRRKETNQIMEVVGSICKEVNQIVDARPQVQGHKRFVLECSFLAESLLKMIRRCDFDVFYRLERARELYLSGDIADSQKLRELMQCQSKADLSTRGQFLKRLFSFSAPLSQQAQSSQIQEERPQNKNYQIGLQQYQRLRHQLEGKLPSTAQPASKQAPSYKHQQGQKGLCQQGNGGKAEGPKVRMTESVIEVKHSCYNSAYCSLCDEICNTQVTSELNKVQEMSSYLMDLLGFT